MLTRPGVKGGYLETNKNNLPDFTVAMCIHEDNTFLFVLKKLFHPQYGALFLNHCRNKQTKIYFHYYAVDNHCKPAKHTMLAVYISLTKPKFLPFHRNQLPLPI